MWICNESSLALVTNSMFECAKLVDNFCFKLKWPIIHSPFYHLDRVKNSDSLDDIA
jgi:hypothetical protein